MRTSVLLLITVAVLATGIHCACDYSQCGPRCANPDYSVDKCCGDCTNSACQFEGCVSYGAFGPTWYPRACLSCYCSHGEPHCTDLKAECPTLNCFGHPQIQRSGECCPVCDFGIAEDECGSVPIKKTTKTVIVNGKECLQTEVQNGCDKTAVQRDGEWYACIPREVPVDTTVPSSCEDVQTVEKATCAMVEGSKLADFSPPFTQNCIPV